MNIRRTLLCGFTSLLLSLPAAAQDGKVYKTPQDAVDSMASAAEARDDDRMETIFGHDIMTLLDGDRKQRVETYRMITLLVQERWDLAPTEDGGKIVRLGLEGWPFPVPLVKADKGWRFDLSQGAEELLNRRIGRNELLNIESLHRIAIAEADYFKNDADGDGVKAYSSRTRSTPGKKDGLYWEIKPGETPSPLEKALADSFRFAQGREAGAPWFGYYYRSLDRQTSAAKGGAFAYLVDGKQTNGYAVVAYPANYGKSGIMTFMMNQDGTVFEKDLGPDTLKQVVALPGFDPGEGWTEVDPSVKD